MKQEVEYGRRSLMIYGGAALFSGEWERGNEISMQWVEIGRRQGNVAYVGRVTVG